MSDKRAVMLADGGEDKRAVMLADGREDKSPECKLWRAVILSAWRDAFERADATLENSDSEPDGDRRATAETIRGDARRWFCSDIEPWKSDRIEVCDRADVDPNTIQRVAITHRDSLRATDEAHSEREQRRTAKRFEERLERLAARSDRYSPKRLDLLLRRLAKLEDARL